MNLFQRLSAPFRPSRRLAPSIETLRREVEDLKLLCAQGLAAEVFDNPKSLHATEFKVTSQFGDDGIIQYLTRMLKLPENLQTFIEFGVEDYREANTRFLLQNNHWRGLVFDSNPKHIAAIRQEALYWREDLTAVSAHITRENIDTLVRKAGFSGEIGLLTIDIDGNDYWVWEAMKGVDPVVVVIEYNSVFGPDAAITVPYQAEFRREEAHFSHLYWGASLGALTGLGEKRGYTFVGCNSAGNNAYFVKKRHAEKIPRQVFTGFVEARFRESRDKSGALNFLRGEEKLRAIEHLDVYDLVSNSVRPLKDALRLTMREKSRA